MIMYTEGIREGLKVKIGNIILIGVRENENKKKQIDVSNLVKKPSPPVSAKAL